MYIITITLLNIYFSSNYLLQNSYVSLSALFDFRLLNKHFSHSSSKANL